MEKGKKASIVTVTMNPALDQTVYCSHFQLGQVNRVSRERIDPGGKGINVAKVLKALGHEVEVTGFLGRDNIHTFRDCFRTSGISDFFVEVGGATRVNIKIVDESDGHVSEINFPGFKYRTHDVDALKITIQQLASKADFLILSGSLPQDAPPGIYKELIETLKSYSCKIFLDTSGMALVEGIRAKPYAIKPNIDELSEVVGYPVASDVELMKAVDDLLLAGITEVVVSLGEKGALVADHTGCFMVRTPVVSVGSTVGAGDAMVAGLVSGEIQGLSIGERGRFAAAVAAASVAQPGTQAGSILDVERLLPHVTLENVRV